MRAKTFERAGDTRKRVVLSDDGKGDPENKKKKIIKKKQKPMIIIINGKSRTPGKGMI